MCDSKSVLQVETALASDAARLITDAVESAPEGIEIAPQPLECGSEEGWEAGEEFTNHLLTVIFLFVYTTSPLLL